MSQQYQVSAQAQNSLVKMLSKLNLISPDSVWTSAEYFPIAYFAKAGAYPESAALEAVSKQLGVALFEVTPERFASLVSLLEDSRIKYIELAGWKSWRAMPVSIDTDSISIAFANPLDRETQSHISFTLGLTVIPLLASEEQINSVLSKQLNLNEAFKLENIIIAAGGANQPQMSRASAHESNVSGDDIDSAPVIRLVNKILSESVDRNASDIHIEPQRDGLEVRVRVDGIMHELLKIPNQIQSPVTSRIKLLCGLDIAEKRRPQDGRLRIKTTSGTKDLRVSTVPSVYGESIVARILSSDVSNLSFDALGMPEKVRARYERALLGSSRVILVTGPTGSGKTSTLYTGLLSLTDGDRSIVTIEDPIEYRLGGITQIQVNPKVGLNFAEGLRSIVRQDPDVVMVGEIRDHETASIAMQTAQTGHLVLSTFHTNNAASSVTRLRDLGVPSYVIASSLSCIMAQRLVRKLCKTCCAPAEDSVRQRLTAVGHDHAGVKKAVGCEKCHNSGYAGRTGIYSMLEVDDQVREAIRTDKGEAELEKLARVTGFESLGEAALELIVNGVTTLEEVERVLGPLEQSLPAQVFMAPANSPGMQRRKVLLVEDDENTRSVLSMLLQNEFFDVVEAENGLDGLEKVFKDTPDIILLDLMMPRMDGSQMLKKLRADPRTNAVPVLMLTAAATEENELNLMDKGADDFVSKTSDSRILIARMQRLLSRAHA